MAQYGKFSLCCTACLWGALALVWLVCRSIPFPFLAAAMLLYYGASIVAGVLATSAFRREWLRLFPDQPTRYDDVRWGNAKNNFMPMPFEVRAGFRQMGQEMLASPDKTDETRRIVDAALQFWKVVVFHFVVICLTSLLCLFL